MNLCWKYKRFHSQKFIWKFNLEMLFISSGPRCWIYDAMIRMWIFHLQISTFYRVVVRAPCCWTNWLAVARKWLRIWGMAHFKAFFRKDLLIKMHWSRYFQFRRDYNSAPAGEIPLSFLNLSTNKRENMRDSVLDMPSFKTWNWLP